MAIETVKNLLPNKEIKIPVSYLFSVIILILSLGIGWGSYKTAFDSQSQAIVEGKKQVESLKQEVEDLRYDMGRLKQALDDLRESIDRKH